MKTLKVIYLCAREHRLKPIEGVEVIYNDIDPRFGCDLVGDCMDVKLRKYDILIATPPCNYWSKANYRREFSKVAQATKHLLPDLLMRFEVSGKPYIIENVDNMNLMIREFNASRYPWFRNGHHIYFSNLINTLWSKDFICPMKQELPQGHRDNNEAVDYVLNEWLASTVRYIRECNGYE